MRKTTIIATPDLRTIPGGDTFCHTMGREARAGGRKVLDEKPLKPDRARKFRHSLATAALLAYPSWENIASFE